MDPWSKQWKVDFNPKKTVNVNFSRKHFSHPNVKFGLNGPLIEPSNNHTHLGQNFQCDANWKSHIQITYEKACKRLNVLRMLKYSLCRDALIKIYMSFIRPVLEYGDVVWNNCNEKESSLLEEVQITAARIITGMRVNSSRSLLYDVHKLILFLQNRVWVSTTVPSRSSKTLYSTPNLIFIKKQ